jgi:hypothetical protein
MLALSIMLGAPFMASSPAIAASADSLQPSKARGWCSGYFIRFCRWPEVPVGDLALDVLRRLDVPNPSRTYRQTTTVGLLFRPSDTVLH